MKNYSEIDTEEIIKDYLICALWSSGPDGDEFDNYEFSKEAKKKLSAEVHTFINENVSDIIKSGLTPEQFGHSLWLTQNRHGAGFFDFSMDAEVLKRLTFNAQKMGEKYLYRTGKKINVG